MANEIRLRRNNIAGTITDNPLTSGATTINSPGFVDLPVVDTTNHLILVLDPLETAGAAEIVRVTAHTAAASVVTVVRGAENTTPRQHALNTTWFHGPVVSDWARELATSGARPAVPFTGEAIYETDTVRLMNYNGAAWGQEGLLFDPPACRVFNSASQACADAAATALTFNSERYDTDSMHSTAVNTSRITINTAGLYLIEGGFVLDTRGDYFQIAIQIRLNNLTTIASNSLSGNGAANVFGHLTTSTVYKLAATDYLELLVYQDNGANVAVNSLSAANYGPEFGATWIGRGN